MNSLTLVLGLVFVGIVLPFLLINVIRSRRRRPKISVEKLSEFIQRGENFSARDYGEDTARMPGDITTDAPPPDGRAKKKKRK